MHHAVRKSYGFQVEDCYFDAGRLPPDLVDEPKVFALSHVIEHLDNPLGILHEVIAVMRSGDLIYIEVPLHTGQEFAKRGYAWSLWFHEHVALYSSQSLAALAARLGLEVADQGTRVFARASESGKTRIRLFFQSPARFLKTWWAKPAYLSMPDVLMADYGFIVLRRGSAKN